MKEKFLGSIFIEVRLYYLSNIYLHKPLHIIFKKLKKFPVYKFCYGTK